MTYILQNTTLTHDIMPHFVFKTQLNTYERKGKDKYHSNKALLKLRISKKMFKIPLLIAGLVWHEVGWVI